MKYISEIYAELSKSQLKKIQSGEYEISVPYNVKCKFNKFNNKPSRALKFTCNDKIASKLLIDGLDASGISWQVENYEEI